MVAVGLVGRTIADPLPEGRNHNHNHNSNRPTVQLLAAAFAFPLQSLL